MTEKALLRRVVVDPKVMLGKAVLRGTRLPVELIVEKLAFGASFDDIRSDYPFLTTDDIRAALLYAARAVAREEVYAV